MIEPAPLHQDRAGYAIDLTRVIVAPKSSKLTRDMQLYGISRPQLLAHYDREGVNPTRIVESHERQEQTLKKLHTLLPQARYLSYDQLVNDPAACDTASLVIALGGDNHFQFVAQHLRDTPILGINSDPQSSYGDLLKVRPENLTQAIEALRSGSFRLEGWSRLQVSLDGATLGLACCEVFAGELERTAMSRHMLARESPLEARSFEAHEQKCSGLLVATGSGSGGWFRSASRYLDPRGDEHLSRLDVTDRWESASFAPQLRKAHFVAAEPSSAIVKQRTGPGAFEHVSGTLLEGEALTARSRNDSHGIIALDAQRQYEFPLGHELRVELTQQPLWHLRLEAGKV